MVWSVYCVTMLLLKRKKTLNGLQDVTLTYPLYPPGIRQRCHFLGILGGLCWSIYPDFTCMKPPVWPSLLQAAPHTGTPHTKRIGMCRFLDAYSMQSYAYFFQHLIFPNKRRNQAHKTQQWIDEQLCIYIEFPGNKACSPTSLSLFRGKLCFAFTQCPLPSPVCPPNLN